jgi:pilus assembly protein CpaB
VPLRALLLAVAAVAIAALVYLGGQKLLASPAVAPPPPVAGVEVLVAVRPLAAGMPIAPGDIGWRAWPAGSVDPSYLRRGDKAADVAGKVARIAYAPGQPLSRDTLARQGEAGTLALAMAPGMRAVSLAVNAASAVSGLIMPGDRVDIVLSHSLPRAADATFDHHAAITLVRDRRVLAIEQRLGSKTDATATVGVAANPIEPRTASIEVEPREAEMLALASDLGKLSLVLRPLQRERDGGERARATPTRDTDLDPLFAGGPPSHVATPFAVIPAATRPARSGPTIFRGSQADTGAGR